MTDRPTDRLWRYPYGTISCLFVAAALAFESGVLFAQGGDWGWICLMSILLLYLVVYQVVQFWDFMRKEQERLDGGGVEIFPVEGK